MVTPATSRQRQRAAGMTLVELLTVVAIILILAGVGFPAAGGLIDGQRARSASSDLYTALLQARSEAIKRNTQVTLAPVTADGTWQGGWGIANPADSGHPILRHNAITGATITGPTSVVYLANGRVRGSTAPKFEVSMSRITTKRCVQVDLSGRPVASTSACPT